MASKIETYKKMKNGQHKCKEWASLIGNPYNGGGGGIGKVVSVSLCAGDNSPTIYHQAYNGATNYHRMPDELREYLEKSIRENMTALLERAFCLQTADLNELAIEAKKEYDLISEDAGSVT